MPKCRICGEWFVGGNSEHDENICMYCYALMYAKKTIAEAKR